MPTHPQTIFSELTYDGPAAAVAWLKEAFGFDEHVVFIDADGAVLHAELGLGASLVMLVGVPVTPEASSPVRLGGASAVVYVAVDDPDTHCAPARAAGADIFLEPHDTFYGAREYGCRDPEGHPWRFGTFRPEAASG